MGTRTSKRHLPMMPPLWLLLLFLMPSVAIGAQYPTVTVNDAIVECRAPAVSVQLDISIEDNDDPLLELYSTMHSTM